MSTPDLHLKTCLVLNDDGRIVSTREPRASRGPLFTLIRGATSCAWAVRADVPGYLASELDRLARDEPPTHDFHEAPVHADRYVSLLEGRIASSASVKQPVHVTKSHRSDGPAFEFPDSLAPAPAQQSADMVVVEDERLIEHHFGGWAPGEIEAGRSPVLAIIEDGYPVSICFCARRSGVAAEAGLDTAAAYRGRGYGPRVAAAWALAIRSSGRTPLYSTAWTNHASLAVARKLNLLAYASSWALSD
jgi:hypothetical protein